MTKKDPVSRPKRRYRHTLSFNDKEIKFIENFITKYKIKNRSKFFREAIIAAIFQKMEDDYPTLF
jgi:metal-responsive CopG/Arc/MetJ family transcriptional regulator